MAAQEKSTIERNANKRRKDEKRGHKRKRKTSAEESLIETAGKHQGESAIADPDAIVKTKADDDMSNGNSLPPGTPRSNPFVLPSSGSKTILKNGGTVSIQQNIVTSPPSSPASAQSSLKKTVEFHASDSSEDDQEYSPPKKRKLLGNISSPRHSQSPVGKAILASPKKVANREKLLQRRQELQDEREKLPIWSGMASLA